MRSICVLILLFLASPLKGQDILEWDENYEIRLSDFKSNTTRIGNSNVYSLKSNITMSFSFYISNMEFMMTKNFNSKVNCSFNRSSASFVAPDTLTALSLIDFARYEFDLSELYARKLRQKIFESKGAFSDINFINPLYNQVHQELADRHNLAMQITNIGLDKEKLELLHKEVKEELDQMADFCKTCKPPKKKKAG